MDEKITIKNNNKGANGYEQYVKIKRIIVF